MGMALDESDNTEDYKAEYNDITIVLDTVSKQHLEHGNPITIDFQDTPYGAGFQINSGSCC